MAKANNWTREQLLVAFALYSQLPFGRLHARNPEIIHYANLIGRTPSALAMKLVNIASLDPYIIESGRKGLQAASNADREMWKELNERPMHFEHDCQQALEALVKPQPQSAQDKTETEPDYTGKERRTSIDARIGQHLFRRDVLDNFENRCCVTGLEEPKLLIASHILPWKKEEKQRLNPSNGLCLSTLHDRAFDQGLITFNEHLELVLSGRIKKLKGEVVEDNFFKYEGKAMRLPAKWMPDEGLLAFHRGDVFVG